METGKDKPVIVDKKARLVYSGEVILFAIAFVVLGILLLLGVIPMTERRALIFTYVTLCGGILGLGDIVWVFLSKKRRKKNSLIDKALLVPSALAVVSCDIYSLSAGLQADLYYQILMSTLFFYLGAAYLFEGIYHYHKPIPALVEAQKEEDEKEQKETDPQKEDTTKV
jgi:hypothetical protein